jgi:hypothetical protein
LRKSSRRHFRIAALHLELVDAKKTPHTKMQLRRCHLWAAWACAVRALVAPPQRRAPPAVLQAEPFAIAAGLAAAGGAAVLLSEDTRDIDDKTEVEKCATAREHASTRVEER